MGGVIDQQLPLAAAQHDLVLTGGGRSNQLQVEFTLEALLHDFHVQEAEEAAAEAEAKGGRRLRLKGEARVVEVQLLKRLTQGWVVFAAQRIESGEDERQCHLVARERFCGGARLRCDGVTNTRIAHALQPSCDVADLAGDQLLHRHMLRSEVAELHWNTGHARAHHQNRIARLESPLLDSDVVHHALVRVVVRVKDQRAERRIKRTTRCGDARNECLENFGDADPRLRRRKDHLFAWNCE